MPSPRFTIPRTIACGLGLTVVANLAGCRTPRGEVPPERPYVSQGTAASAPPIGFSSQPSPDAYGALHGGTPGGPTFSTQPAGTTNLGAPMGVQPAAALPAPEPLQELPGIPQQAPGGQ